MNLFILLKYYTVWHYSKALSDIVHIEKNFFIFINNFFSIKTLFFSLFSPWKKLNGGYVDGMSLEDRAGTFVVNMMMRIVGAVIRLFFVIAGILSLFGLAVIAIISLALWIILPFIIIYLLFWSIVGLFN